MPKDKSVQKVLVVGSGPIVIGQAAEFDYAGTQACVTLKEAGCEVVLLNNNPATMMTDENIAHKVYFEPLTVKTIENILEKEQPDSILLSVSGQTGLNLAFALDEQNILEKYKVQVLGTPIDAIKQGEDRELFRSLMHEMDEPIPESAIVATLEEAITFSDKVGYPVIIRPAYTLGGSGGGIATGENELINYITRGLRESPIGQCLIEKSIAGWKEIEMEVVRDKADNAVIVCTMENIDPVGVHTGDSIVVAPIQTLNEKDIEKLKQASLNIVREIGIVGACNVQLAFDVLTKEYKVIEINPRVSRSSALASKATGYPIAKIATKLSIGYTLSDIYHANEQTYLTNYEPAMGYVVVKFPSWPFEKLKTADRKLGTQMKATEETIAIADTLEAAIQKAVRSLELDITGLSLDDFANMHTTELRKTVLHTDDRRFFALLELMRRGITVELIHKATQIDVYFLEMMHRLIKLEAAAKAQNVQSVTVELFQALKAAGFTDGWLANVWDCSLETVWQRRESLAIFPTYRTVKAFTEREEQDANYFYAVWKNDRTEKNVQPTHDKKIIIIGSGPIQIGQGVEFDYCSVQGIQALQQLGYETILINNNPATVSTDYEFADKLYLEPITAEDVRHMMEIEETNKVIVQFGGQTAINLVKQLEAFGADLLGSSLQTIDTLEDREQFYQYLQSIDLPHIPGLIANDEADLYEKATEIGYPMLVRPSYVIGGKGMKIINNKKELGKYIMYHLHGESSYPILIDAYYPGMEIEVDVVTDGKQVLIPTIFEHIEKAGVHSGDSMAVTPPVTLSEEVKEKVVDYTEKIAQGIDFKGIFNIQFVLYEDTLYVLEVNPRASRTVPVSSKVTNVNLIELASKVLVGSTLEEEVGALRILPENDFYTVKAPVFSTGKLNGVDPKLVPEMKSTGELIAVSKNYPGALRKAFIWNEQLAKMMEATEKELYVSGEVTNESLKEALEQEYITVKSEADLAETVTFEMIEKWMKTEAAIAVFSEEENSAIRKRALEFGLLVMTTRETVAAFSHMARENLPVLSLQPLKYTNNKEVVLQ